MRSTVDSKVDFSKNIVHFTIDISVNRRQFEIFQKRDRGIFNWRHKYGVS